MFWPDPIQINFRVASSLWAHYIKFRAPTARGSPETKTQIKIKKINRSKNPKKKSIKNQKNKNVNKKIQKKKKKIKKRSIDQKIKKNQ